MENKKTIILAGNYREFLTFKKTIIPEKQGQYIYGENPENLLGILTNDIQIYGTFWERNDAGKLYDLAKSRIR